METKIKEVLGNGVLGEVATAILNKEIYAYLHDTIVEDENGNPIGNYKFHFLSPISKDILNVSGTVGVLVDITYSEEFYSLEDLRKYVVKNRDRAYNNVSTTPIQGCGYDVVASFISDFSSKLASLGVIPSEMVLDECRSNYRTIEP